MSEKLKTLQVCKICFNASSQKASPTLTTEDKTIVEPTTTGGGGVKKHCPTCRQSWNSQKVGYDPETGRWVTIRPRPLKMPLLTDYTICSNILKKQSCIKGSGVCTFAHSQIELAMWNHERWKEPRPAPHSSGSGGPGTHQLCKYVMNTGACAFGQRCTFAHSEGELQHWVKLQQQSLDSQQQHYAITSSSSVGSDRLYCETCNTWCTGKRQYEEHLKGNRHRSSLNAGTGFREVGLRETSSSSRPFYGSSAVGGGGGGGGGGERVRACPLRLPVGEFRLCMAVLTRRRCYYGDKCTFAHNQTELEAWNQERQRLR